MPDLLPITLDDMIREVERELAKRADVYPRMKSKVVSLALRNMIDRQWDVMEAVLANLENQRGTQ